MADDSSKKVSTIQKFSKINCLWNPKDAKNPKLYDSYAYLDLHLNQFLANIIDEFTFLPHSIYKPSIHVYINEKLVYKTKILDFNNDLFDESIRLKIYSPQTVVTLKLYEHEQFDTTTSEELNIKPAIVFEKSNMVLISWVDLDIGLLVPETDYKAIYTFKANPAFNPYNPGGILYYPSKGSRPQILSKKVCSSCKVCSLLSYIAVGTDKNYETISKYFDYKFVDSATDPSESNEDAKKSDDGDKSDDEEMDLVDVIDMSNLSKRGKKDGCNCLQLRNIPSNFKKNAYEVCLKCHDYEVCCEHTLNNYYLSVNFKLVPSKEKVDFTTELFSSLLAEHLDVRRYSDLASIFERSYQNYKAFECIFDHLQMSKERALLVLRYSLIFLLLGLILNRFLTTLFFLLSVFFFLVRITSIKQFNKDNGDILYSARNTFLSGQGVDKFIMRLLEKEVKEKQLIIQGKVYTVDQKSIERNNLNIPEHNIESKTKLYTKAHMGYRRCENIALKTVCYAISESIPEIVKKTLFMILVMSDALIGAANGVLAVTRYYGVQLAISFFTLGLLSLKFYKLCLFLLKTLLLVVVLATACKDLDAVKYGLSMLKSLSTYLMLRVYRAEWFLNG
ncbi:conserved hypothetical protein [Theileria orientalis strain Shintoku]|uniref:Uncharacterized protein n=1 Tax=Theileria orientalis strain Shintoku TaxID=869250 RepID=J4CCF3_THEOR|nr:conserved hypothetical protein [Theileria orientalis strain Shintoku]PVC51958.1 hypothetical protein MACL_00001113 [Theileria orientalis]BAM39292.1 conserved hypothetical protein [Theileria orientalis strain Shintoku]|eukprot:XP_009689593.1 conserved hypothetical protein [Theileria orientalis strain Shintoku]